MDVWIALVESKEKDRFRFLMCDSRHSITDYIEDQKWITGFRREPFKEKYIQDILEIYCKRIDTEFISSDVLD